MIVTLAKIKDCKINSDGIEGVSIDGVKFNLKYHADTAREYVFRAFFKANAEYIELHIEDGTIGWIEPNDSNGAWLK